ncbi:hypothetical protein HI914_03744 [Erysiphe necator]|nr:hypothetical protein HI914_03744 [Erysiphe necator]
MKYLLFLLRISHTHTKLLGDHVLGDLAKVINAIQFLNRVQSNPELVFQTVKTLAQQINIPIKKPLEKEQHLLLSSKELQAAKETLKEIDKPSGTTAVLGNLVDFLHRLQILNQKSATIRSSSVFDRDKNCFPSAKEYFWKLNRTLTIFLLNSLKLHMFIPCLTSTASPTCIDFSIKG